MCLPIEPNIYGWQCRIFVCCYLIEANEELRINRKINPLLSTVPSEGTVVKLANNSDVPSNGTQRDYW